MIVFQLPQKQAHAVGRLLMQRAAEAKWSSFSFSLDERGDLTIQTPLDEPDFRSWSINSRGHTVHL